MKKIIKWVAIIFGVIILIAIIALKSEEKETVNPVIQEPTPTVQVVQPTVKPTLMPTVQPTIQPTIKPTPIVTKQPSQSKVVVKKSNSNICHAPGTTYYDRTTNYTAYDSIDDCLASGGRLPEK